MVDLLQICTEEFKLELESEDWIERCFARARRMRDPVSEIPEIGGAYRPFAPREQLDALKQKIIRALCARRCFIHDPTSLEDELPLKFGECQMLADCGRAEYRQLGRFGLWLRDQEWKIWLPFAEFCRLEREAPHLLAVHQADEGPVQDSKIIPFRPGSETDPGMD